MPTLSGWIPWYIGGPNHHVSWCGLNCDPPPHLYVEVLISTSDWDWVFKEVIKLK
jgi:hypothetical protein